MLWARLPDNQYAGNPQTDKSAKCDAAVDAHVHVGFLRYFAFYLYNPMMSTLRVEQHAPAARWHQCHL